MGRTQRMFWSFVVAVGLCAVAVPAGALTITQPRENETIYGSRIRLSGTAADRVVIQVVVQRRQVRESGPEWRTIYDERLRTDGEGIWTGTADADGVSGDYRVMARRLDRHGKLISEDSNRFEVQTRGGGHGGGGGEGRGKFSIETPRNGEKVTDDRVVIGGFAPERREVQVRLVASGDRLIAQGEVRSGGDGRWSLTARLPAPDRYRVTAELTGPPNRTPERRLLTFFYAPGEGGGSAMLRITRPDDDSTVRNSPLYVAGRATPGADVRVHLYDARGTQIDDQMTRADREGEWSVRVFLDREGAYRALAELLSDRGGVRERETVNFRYERR